MKNLRTTITRAGAVAGAYMLPVLALAQATTTIPDSELNLDKLTAVVNEILKFIDSTLVPLIFALAFIVFIWGVFQYWIAGAGNEEKRDTGKKFIFWAIIGFVVMICLWGIVGLLVNTLGFGGQNKPCLPTFEGPCR